jgi:hypothetical protein
LCGIWLPCTDVACGMWHVACGMWHVACGYYFWVTNKQTSLNEIFMLEPGSLGFRGDGPLGEAMANHLQGRHLPT